MNPQRQLIAQLITELEREIEVLSTAARATWEAATHEESRPENDKDTRGLESSYLAGAQAERVRDMKSAVFALQTMAIREFDDGAPIGVSAIVTLDRDGITTTYFLAPAGGGMKTTLAGDTISVITPSSAVGRALVGKHVGDVVEVLSPAGHREYEITRLR